MSDPIVCFRCGGALDSGGQCVGCAARSVNVTVAQCVGGSTRGGPQLPHSISPPLPVQTFVLRAEVERLQNERDTLQMVVDGAIHSGACDTLTEPLCVRCQRDRAQRERNEARALLRECREGIADHAPYADGELDPLLARLDAALKGGER